MEPLTEEQISLAIINSSLDEETPLSFISLAPVSDVPTTVSQSCSESRPPWLYHHAMRQCRLVEQLMMDFLRRLAYLRFKPFFLVSCYLQSASSSCVSPLSLDISSSSFSSNLQTHDQEPAHRSQLTTTKRKKKEVTVPKSATDQMMTVAQDAFNQLGK